MVRSLGEGWVALIRAWTKERKTGYSQRLLEGWALRRYDKEHDAAVDTWKKFHRDIEKDHDLKNGEIDWKKFVAHQDKFIDAFEHTQLHILQVAHSFAKGVDHAPDVIKEAERKKNVPEHMGNDEWSDEKKRSYRFVKDLITVREICNLLIRESR
ncbi:MAG: hypothetical protein KJ709_00935 [Nanoarchaeota archaeon]|nr:hypothetical protein [Nanoarchaeota archaeon]